MHQHALQTALTLYQSGTHSVDTAARQAGVPATKLRSLLTQRGLKVREPTEAIREKQRVAAD